MIHLAGFLESLDPAGAFVNMAALADQRLFIDGDNLRVPTLNQVILAAGGAENVTAPRIRLTSPSLRIAGRPELTPLNVATAAGVEPGSPQAVQDMRANPMMLKVDEQLNAELLSNPAAAQVQWALCWFADGVPAPVEGAQEFTSRWTGVTTLTANAWTSVTPTPDDELQPGTYAVTGLRAESAGLIAARFIFRESGNADWRPGVLGCDVISDLEAEMFRHGRLGVLGEFPFTQIPSIECLSLSADTAETFYVDLVQIG
jgi:hypothetical protein